MMRILKFYGAPLNYALAVYNMGTYLQSVHSTCTCLKEWGGDVTN